MKIKILFIFITSLIIMLFLGSSLFFIAKKVFTPQKTHYHAGFVVFQNNKKVNFSDIKYLYLEPCTLNKTNDTNSAAIQIEKAHLHDNIGDLVHIERTGPIWKDLFTNIHYPIDFSKTIGYINGEQVSNYQSKPIKPFDSLVVFIGRNDLKLLTQAVTKGYMIKMAKKSTTCGD